MYFAVPAGGCLRRVSGPASRFSPVQVEDTFFFYHLVLVKLELGLQS